MRSRKTKPSIVLAAVAAAVVASPFAVAFTDDRQRGPVPVDNRSDLPSTVVDQLSFAELPTAAIDLAQTGLAAAGVDLPDLAPLESTVRTIVRDEPLKMVALTWDEPVDTDTFLRSRAADGSWGDWIKLEPVDTATEPSADRPGGTEPVWVGDAREVQFALAPGAEAVPVADGSGIADAGSKVAGSVLDTVLSTALNTLKATLISPESLLSLGSSLVTPLLGGPQIVSRALWGADESIRCSQPTYSPDLKGAVIHHTAGSNDYTPEQSVEIVRGIYAYHARTLNWCDIGYNVLVDKYGQIFEGAFGGLDRNVDGTHTGGFNKSTVGVSMIGNLAQAAPSAPMVQSVASFLKWRLRKGGVNPIGQAHLTAEPFSASKFPAGTVAHLPAISGHRDLNSTDCPGEFGYAALDPIRAMVGGAQAAPEPAPQAPAQ